MKAYIAHIYCKKCKRQMKASLCEEIIECRNRKCVDFGVKWQLPEIELNLPDR